MKKTAKRKSFYTLIEILTVVVIAAILFGIGIPAFTTMIQGNTMTIAVRQFSSKIAAARAYAITNKCRVALLLVEDKDYLGDSGKYSAYRVCTVKDSSNEFDGWIEGEDWKTLPAGVLRNGNIDNLTGITKVPVMKADGSGTEDKDDLKGIVFDKKGQTTHSYTIYLSLGRYVGGGAKPVITDKDGTKEGKQPLTINQYTGKVTTGKFDYF